MKTATRYPVVMNGNTTFRFPFRIGTTGDDVDRVYYSDQDISAVTFKLRSSDNRSWTSYPMTYSNDGTPTWTAVFTPDQTSSFGVHRSLYYGVEVTWASGDITRELEGPVRINPLGGTYK